MRQTVTRAIVIARTNFQEADRILTVLTPDHGKVRLIAKGVRRVKSKLAGGIELLSVNDITFIQGRGEVSTLVSARLHHHFGNIVKDIDRTMLAYTFMRWINRATEDVAEADYYLLIERALTSLDDVKIPLDIIELWFAMQLLKISGHAPNLRTDANNAFLLPDERYEFRMEPMAFEQYARGAFRAREIKVLRLGLRAENPEVIANVTDVGAVISAVLPLARSILKQSVRI